jgi:flagellar hook-associated protein 2
MATGSISSPGLGSNLDVSGIISKLMEVESQPLLQLTTREVGLQSQISLVGQIKSALASFQTAAKTLDTTANKAAYKATVSDAAVLSATASDTSAGTYALVVSQLAQAQRLSTAGQASRTSTIGAGTATTLTLTFGTISGGSFDTPSGRYTGASFAADAASVPATITIDSTNNTLEGIRDAINAKKAGVTASIVNDGSATPQRLVLGVDATGAQRSLKIGVSGDAALQALLAHDPAGTQNFTQLRTAQNARLSVDGVSIETPRNSVAGVVEGLTFELKATGSANITVSRDSSPISNALAQMVKAYNDANKAVTDATAKGQPLQGDTSTSAHLWRLRSQIGAIDKSGSVFSSLSALGVAFQRDGSLSFDATKLQAALDKDYGAALATAGRYAKALGTLAEGMLGAKGTLTAKTDGMNRTLTDIGERRQTLLRRLDQTQTRYLKQFTALDTLMGSLTQTSNYLTQQLNALSNSSK